MKEEEEEGKIDELDDRLLKIGKEALSKRQNNYIKTKEHCFADINDAIEAYKEVNKIDDTASIDHIVQILRINGYSIANNEVIRKQSEKEIKLDAIQEITGEFRKVDESEIERSLRSFEKRNAISVLELGYILKGGVGEPLTSDQFDRLILDLDFDETTGMIPISTLIYFFCGGKGLPPGSKQASRRQMLASQREAH